MAWTQSISIQSANTIFSPIGVIILKNEQLNIYECSGEIKGQNRTLTGLCTAIVVALKDGKTEL